MAGTEIFQFAECYFPGKTGKTDDISCAKPHLKLQVVLKRLQFIWQEVNND